MNPSLGDAVNITGVLLAGGRSRRMGYDKRALHIADISLFEYVLIQLRALCPELLVIANDPEFFAPFDVQVIPDIYPGSSLGGLYTGLYHSSTERIFVSACDMPFFNAELALFIMHAAQGFDAAVVNAGNGYEPLFACYTKRCLQPMRRELERGNYRIYPLFEHLNVRRISPAELSHIDSVETAFTNINKPQDVALAQRYLGNNREKER